MQGLEGLLHGTMVTKSDYIQGLEGLLHGTMVTNDCFDSFHEAMLAAFLFVEVSGPRANSIPLELVACELKLCPILGTLGAIQ